MAAVPPLSSRRACRAELSFGRKLLAAASPRIHSRCTSGEEELLSDRGRAEKASRRRSASRFWSLVHSRKLSADARDWRARVCGVWPCEYVNTYGV